MLPTSAEMNDTAGEETYSMEYGNAVAWTAVVAFSLIHNMICMHVVAEYTEKWKSGDMLIFSLILTEFFNLAMPMSILSIITVAESKWNTTTCQFLLWSMLTFRVVVALHQAFLALDRVWFLKWPSTYRVHFAAHRSSKTVVFIWLLSTLAGFMPILGWEDTTNADVQQTGQCHILLSNMGLGYAVSMEILLMLTQAVGSTCIIACVVGMYLSSQRAARRHRRNNRIPSIVIESETGERTPALEGRMDIRCNHQNCILVCCLVFFDYLIDGIPYVVSMILLLRM
ncbi:putative G-protein coupled receptor 153 [Glandiceps talaboti]